MGPMFAARYTQVMCGVVFFSLIALQSPSALAEGYEFAALGTKPLGRAGAVHVAIDDPLAILYNPANLSVLGRRNRERAQGPFSAQLDVNLAFFDACYQRRSVPNNNYGDVTVGGETSVFGDSADYASQPWPTACNEGPPNPNPTALLAWQPEGSTLGFAFGLLVPSAVGINKWADDEKDTITVGGRDLPPGHRFMVLSQEVLFIQPSLGVGIDLDVLRLGATFQWGIALVKFNSHTAIAAVRGENPDNSVGTVLDVSDLFVPGVILSATAEPVDNLELMLGFHWQDAVRAGGTIDFTTGVYGRGNLDAGTEGQIPSTNRVNGVGFTAPQPWYLTFGVRYAHEEGKTELWDIELDIRYAHSSSLDQFEITIPAGEMIDVQQVNSDGTLAATPTSVPARVTIPHRWRDQLGLRLGGDVRVLPELLSARAGVSFETNGTRPAYAQLDFWPTQRLGLHAGLTLEVGQFDLSLSYAHLFNETVTTQPDEAAVPQLVAVGDRPVSVNAGVYASNIDVVSLGVVWRP